MTNLLPDFSREIGSKISVYVQSLYFLKKWNIKQCSQLI